MSNSFNFDEALKDLQAGKDLTGKDGRGAPIAWTVNPES